MPVLTQAEVMRNMPWERSFRVPIDYPLLIDNAVQHSLNGDRAEESSLLRRSEARAGERSASPQLT